MLGIVVLAHGDLQISVEGKGVRCALTGQVVTAEVEVATRWTEMDGAQLTVIAQIGNYLPAHDHVVEMDLQILDGAAILVAQVL